jgi:hypothetical protein
MPERWLQIKGDPAVRGFLFEQQRVESLFDKSIGRIHDIVRALLTRKGVFHIKIHYSSSQLTCWFARDPFCYKKFLREEVLVDGFLNRFPDADYTGHKPVLESHCINRIFKEFLRLRLTDQTIYLRNGSVNWGSPATALIILITKPSSRSSTHSRRLASRHETDYPLL